MSGNSEPPPVEAEAVPKGPTRGQRFWRKLKALLRGLKALLRGLMWLFVGLAPLATFVLSLAVFLAKEPLPPVLGLIGGAFALASSFCLGILVLLEDDSADQIRSLSDRVASLEKAREKDAQKIGELKRKPPFVPPLPVGDAQTDAPPLNSEPLEARIASTGIFSGPSLDSGIALQQGPPERPHRTDEDEARLVSGLPDYVKDAAPVEIARLIEPPPAQDDQTAQIKQKVRLALLCGGLRLAQRVRNSEPSYLLRRAFCSYRDDTFLNLAQLLGRQDDLIKWQRALADAIFFKGASWLLGRLLKRRSPAADMDEGEAERLVAEVRVKVVDHLKKGNEGINVGVAEEKWAMLGDVVAEGLRLAWDLLTSPTPGWLILPERGDTFEPDLHEAIDRMPWADVRIDRLVFPGYVLRGTPDMVEKAKVMLESGGA